MSHMDFGWTENAACRNHDPEIFFPERQGKGAHRDAVWALAICRTCPVTAQCENLRRATGSTGVWGGKYYHEKTRRMTKHDYH